MDHRIPAQQVEIQGFYWPRILRPDPELRSSLVGNKKGSKKVHKAITGMGSISKNSIKKITTTARVPCKELASNSLLEVLRDVPFLIPSSEYHQGRYSPRSPITGKLFSSTTGATTSNKRNSVGRSRLVPTKLIRKNVLDRKLHSRTTPWRESSAIRSLLRLWYSSTYCTNPLWVLVIWISRCTRRYRAISHPTPHPFAGRRAADPVRITTTKVANTRSCFSSCRLGQLRPTF